MSELSIHPGAPRGVQGVGLTGSIAVPLARTIGHGSRLWKQVGLGTIFKVLQRLPRLGAAQCHVEFLPDAHFSVGTFEPYWGPVLVAGRPYEPELWHSLRRMQLRTPPVFVDCGANIGFWSVIATSVGIGFERAVAIEANPSTFELLLANARLNDDRFQCVNRAVADESGRVVRLAQAEHHVVARIGTTADNGPEVKTVSIDDVIAQLGWDDAQAFVVKLDVEGHELPAFRGAKTLWSQKSVLLILEDFASRGWETIRFLMESESAYYVTPTGRCLKLTTQDSIRKIVASEPKRGLAHNFLVTQRQSEFDRLLSAWSTP